MNGLESLLDQKLFSFLNRSVSNPLFDALMPFVTDNAVPLLLPILLFILYQDRKKGLLAIILSLSALSLSDGLANILKHLIQRPRPFSTMTDVITLVGRGGSFSMPSGHATNVFSVTTVLIYMLFRGRSRGQVLTFDINSRGYLSSFFKALYVKCKDRAPLILSGYLVLIACAVAFSRVYVGVHYPTDVLVGGTIGFLTGIVVIFSFIRIEGFYRVAPYPTVLSVMLLALSLFRIYYILNGSLDLSPDEAHYWDWSRRLDLSYYSKGPAIAYIIALGTSLMGNTEIGVRLPAVFFSLFSSIIIYHLAKDIARMNTAEGSRVPGFTGLVSALLIQVVPLFSTYGIIMTIDSPFMFIWTLSLYLFFLLQKDWPETGKRRLWLWALLGLSVGIGLLTKYTMAFFYLSAFLYLITNREKRSLLLQPSPWLAFLISLLCFAPVVIWNSQHNWVTFLHTAGQAHLSEGMKLTIGRFFEFIGSQLGVITPVVLIFVLISLFALRKRVTGGDFLFWFSIPILLIFSLKSLQGKVQANWTLPAYIAGFVSVSLYAAKYWEIFKKSTRLILVAGVLISVVVTVVALYPSALNLPPKLDPTARLRGWKQLGKKLSRIAAKMERPYFIFADRYQVTSELAFNVKGNPGAYFVNIGRRMNQYDLWPGFYGLKGYNAIFVRTGTGALPEEIEGVFEECRRRPFVVMERGRVLRDYTIFQCYGFKGMERKLPGRF